MIAWVPRAEPLTPRGAFAAGPMVVPWVKRLLKATDVALACWSGVGDRQRVLVIGEGLPWVDGLVWLGVDPEAPGLYLPCVRVTEIHPALIASRILLPAALLPDCVVALAQARPLARERLAALL